jgi:hypothetical protein
MGEHRLTEGARLLRAHIRASGDSIPVWCERFGLDRIQVQRVLNGERWQRISVDFAHSVEVATSGAVPFGSWLSRLAQPVEPGSKF